jgi:hypothetical protein
MSKVQINCQFFFKLGRVFVFLIIIFFSQGYVAPDNLQEVQVDINYDVDRCNKSIQTNLGLQVPATGICVENKNPYSPACHVSINLQVLVTGICVENKNPYSPACHVSINLQVLVTGICVENKNPYSPACHVSITL